ncbi:MAG: hypothetical protein ACMUEL_03685 [Flavobacteriales bacterium Tduv]
MILEVHSVAANEHYSRGAKAINKQTRNKLRKVYAEKGYQVLANVS